MVVSKDIAREKYRKGIQDIGGPSKYFECGRKADTGPAIEVAKCLQAAKTTKAASAEEWADRWAKRMYG